MKFSSILITIIFLIPFLVFSQEQDTILRKKITIPRITIAPKIDGVLSDEAWEKAPIAKNFFERQPQNGRPIPDSLQTEVKIIYDDLGIYFGAVLKDPQPDKIMKELTERDRIGADDFFFILLNGYNDRQQSMQFIVTAAGVQYDAKMTNGNEDSSWNAVWYSAVEINEDNWTVEVFIPYSELRFPKKEVQVWGLQMEREFRRTGTRYSWSPINNAKGSFSIYDGEVYGIENIDTPTRLSFQPYVSSYLNNFDGKTTLNFNGGLDLKYGINDAFTLDMILIPDFGQTRFDEAVLNLSAFEVQYDEQRPFFTEGTELFSKGNLFYSRRVGGAPTGRIDLAPNEEIVAQPIAVDLINALKISGRTDEGLGIGIFNAVTEKSLVDIRNIETGEIRKDVIEPMANYNILVLDQRFGENSSVSLVNTNVLRDGSFRDANATGIYTDLTNRKNTYRYRAGLEGSWVLRESTKFGSEGFITGEKISGKNRIAGVVEFRTLDYDINDLGYSSFTNYIRYRGNYSYRLLQPKGILNNMFLNFNLGHDRRLEPDLFNRLILNFNANFTTKDFLSFGGGLEGTPIKTQDIYEPRVEGRYVVVPKYVNPWVWFNTDFRKQFRLNVVIDWYKYLEEGRGTLNIDFNPNYRVSDKLKLRYGANISLSDKEQGFVNLVNNDIIFGQRNRNTIINSLGGNYIFNNTMALNLDFRHYFSDVSYTQFYTLQDDGELAQNENYAVNHNTTYNSWNIDLRFSWWFAPGSQVSVLYRNAIDSYVQESQMSFTNNFNVLFDQPQVNNLSLRITYFLDYNRMKTWFNPSNSTISAREEGPRDHKMGKDNIF